MGRWRVSGSVAVSFWRARWWSASNAVPATSTCFCSVALSQIRGCPEDVRSRMVRMRCYLLRKTLRWLLFCLRLACRRREVGEKKMGIACPVSVLRGSGRRRTENHSLSPCIAHMHTGVTTLVLDSSSSNALVVLSESARVGPVLRVGFSAAGRRDGGDE
jgi:hypothetical protein